MLIQTCHSVQSSSSFIVSGLKCFQIDVERGDHPVSALAGKVINHRMSPQLPAPFQTFSTSDPDLK